MAGFDGETYLRTTGERWVREGHGAGRWPADPVLPACGAALVAVGAVPRPVARAVINQYLEAQALRQGLSRHVLSGRPSSRPVPPPASERTELTGEPPGAQVRTEPLPEQDPAVRHLWERVATFNDFHDQQLALDTTIAALIAAGALSADDPVIGQARSVQAALWPDRARQAQDPPGGPGDPPQAWLSLLARWGQAGGPVGTILVAARTPPFDGVTVRVVALRSADEHFTVEVELVPGARVGLPYRDLPDQQHLTWWAADNLGNHYLGEHGSWYSGDDRSEGAIGFWPALDARASRVDLMPTASTERAVMSVPLDWMQQP